MALEDDAGDDGADLGRGCESAHLHALAARMRAISAVGATEPPAQPVSAAPDAATLDGVAASMQLPAAEAGASRDLPADLPAYRELRTRFGMSLGEIGRLDIGLVREWGLLTRPEPQAVAEEGAADIASQTNRP